MVFELLRNNSVASHYFAQIRDVDVQKDRMRFRKNLERLGEILAYEVSKSFTYESQKVHTPLGDTSISAFDDQPVLIPILRAAIPFYQGVLNMFDEADSGFVGAWRVEGTEQGVPEVALNYIATPEIDGRCVVIIDPMLATGNSLLLTMDHLLKRGKPKQVFILSLIASKQGMEHVQDNMTVPYTIYVGAIDEHLDDQAFIVPGLGDAGDLSFGQKI